MVGAVYSWVFEARALLPLAFLMYRMFSTKTTKLLELKLALHLALIFVREICHVLAGATLHFLEIVLCHANFSDELCETLKN